MFDDTGSAQEPPESVSDSGKVQGLIYTSLPKSVFDFLVSAVPVLLSLGSCPLLHLCQLIIMHLFSAPTKTPVPFRNQGQVSFPIDQRDSLA